MMPLFSKCSFTIFLLLFSCKSFSQFKFIHGTCILTLITKDSIWIAADSKSGYSPVEKVGVQNAASVCKVFSYRNINYAVSGMPIVTDLKDSVIMDTRKELYILLEKGGDFIDIMKQCNEVLMPKLYYVWQNQLPKSLSKEKERFWFVEHPNILQISLSGFSKGNPIHLNWAYNLNGSKDKWNIYTAISLKVDADSKTVFPVISTQGMVDSVVDYLKVNKRFFKVNGNRKNDLTTLIKLEIAKYKYYVGLPIVVKVLYANGNKWLTPHKFCQ